MVSDARAGLLTLKSNRTPIDAVPDHIEDMYSEFVDEETGPSPQLFDGLNYEDAGWLQVHARHQISLAK